MQAIDLMDEAASNMRVQLESTPEEIDSLQRALYRVQVEEKALAKEKDKVPPPPPPAHRMSCYVTDAECLGSWLPNGALDRCLLNVATPTMLILGCQCR